MAGWVVVVTDQPVMPPRSGTAARIHAMIAALRQAGFKVAALVHDGPGRAGLDAYCDTVVPVRGPAFASGNPKHFDYSSYASALTATCRRLDPVGVIVEYIWLAPCLGHVGGGVARILDTHDVFHERTRRFTRAKQNPWGVCSRAEERTLLRHADVVLAIQAREAGVLGSLVGRSRVMRVGHAVRTQPFVQAAGRDDVMFVGFNHPGNLGILDFARHGWPAVKERSPGARLRIYGSIVKRLPEIPDPSVEKVGEVDDLSRAYADAAVVVCPITLGTGLKIKLVEAMAHGKAIVTTSEGLRGLEDAADAVAVADDWSAFGEHVGRLLRDTAARSALARSAHAFAGRFSPEATYGGLVNLLRRRASDREKKRVEIYPPALQRLARNLPAKQPSDALPFVTVVIPVFNDSVRLRQCLQALQLQTYPAHRFEVVVVDNNSTDDIRAVVADFPRARYAQELRRGPAAARNTGVMQSRGEIIAFTDSDCIPEPGWLEAGVRSVRRRAPRGLVVGRVQQFAKDPERPNAAELLDQVTYLDQRWAVELRNSGATANIFAPLSVFLTVGLFDPAMNLASFEDWDWTQRVFRSGLPLVYAEDAVILHPSRGSLREMLRKARRIEQGRLLYGRKLNALPEFSLRRILADLWPRQSFLFNAWRCRRLAVDGKKRGALPVVVLVYYYTILYRFWLAFARGATR